MNRRAFRLVLFALVIATMGALIAPGVAIADPIGDKQAEAAQLEAQINTNAEKLSAWMPPELSSMPRRDVSEPRQCPEVTWAR